MHQILKGTMRCSCPATLSLPSRSYRLSTASRCFFSVQDAGPLLLGFAQSKLPFRLANPSVEFFAHSSFVMRPADEVVDPAIQCRFRFCQLGLGAVVLFGDIDAKVRRSATYVSANVRMRFGSAKALRKTPTTMASTVSR
jgi:hypothetical protein